MNSSYSLHKHLVKDLASHCSQIIGFSEISVSDSDSGESGGRPIISAILDLLRILLISAMEFSA